MQQVSEKAVCIGCLNARPQESDEIYAFKLIA